MTEAVDKGTVAFHLVMALCADLAIHDELQIARMQDTLGRMLESSDNWSEADRADLRAAYDALLQLDGKRLPTSR